MDTNNNTKLIYLIDALTGVRATSQLQNDIVAAIDPNIQVRGGVTITASVSANNELQTSVDWFSGSKEEDSTGYLDPDSNYIARHYSYTDLSDSLDSVEDFALLRSHATDQAQTITRKVVADLRDWIRTTKETLLQTPACKIIAECSHSVEVAPGATGPHQSLALYAEEAEPFTMTLDFTTKDFEYLVRTNPKTGLTSLLITGNVSNRNKPVYLQAPTVAGSSAVAAHTVSSLALHAAPHAAVDNVKPAEVSSVSEPVTTAASSHTIDLVRNVVAHTNYSKGVRSVEESLSKDDLVVDLNLHTDEGYSYKKGSISVESYNNSNAVKTKLLGSATDYRSVLGNSSMISMAVAEELGIFRMSSLRGILPFPALSLTDFDKTFNLKREDRIRLAKSHRSWEHKFLAIAATLFADAGIADAQAFVRKDRKGQVNGVPLSTIHNEATEVPLVLYVSGSPVGHLSLHAVIALTKLLGLCTHDPDTAVVLTKEEFADCVNSHELLKDPLRRIVEGASFLGATPDYRAIYQGLGLTSVYRYGVDTRTMLTPLGRYLVGIETTTTNYDSPLSKLVQAGVTVNVTSKEDSNKVTFTKIN